VPTNTIGSLLRPGPKLLVKERVELPLALLMLLANVYAKAIALAGLLRKSQKCEEQKGRKDNKPPVDF